MDHGFILYRNNSYFCILFFVHISSVIFHVTADTRRYGPGRHGPTRHDVAPAVFLYMCAD